MIRRLKRLMSIANVMRRRGPSTRGASLGTRFARGQIATFVLLAIVVVLIFAMMTANMGQLVHQATTTSNAADSAALLLASQLATKSNQLFNALGGRYEKCKKGGFLAIILAIIVAIVVIVVTWGAATGFAVSFVTWAAANTATVVVAGAAGGAIGGAIGGAVMGTGAAQGALQGAAIGAAIGFGVSAFAHLGTTTTMTGGVTPVAGKSVGTTLYYKTAGDAAAGILSMANDGGLVAGGAILTGTGSVAVPVVSTMGAIAGGSLAAGSAIYNEAVKDRMTSKAFDRAIKALNSLPEVERARQRVVLEALSLVVDDPVTVEDGNDVDGDGDTKERVPRFRHLWDTRMTNALSFYPGMKQKVDDFVKGPLETFKKTALETFNACPPPKPTSWYGYAYRTEQMQRGAWEWPDQWLQPRPLEWGGWAQWYGGCGNDPGWLARKEIEGKKQQWSVAQQVGGLLEQVARPLEGATDQTGQKINVSFWDEGPIGKQYQEWSEKECGAATPQASNTCSNALAPAGWDEADEWVEELANVVENIDAVRIWRDQSLDGVTSSWTSWATWFYDPASDPNAKTPELRELYDPAYAPEADDTYARFERLMEGSQEPKVVGMKHWVGELEEIKNKLPACQLGYTHRNWNYHVMTCEKYPSWDGIWGDGGYYQHDCVINPPCQGERKEHPFDRRSKTIKFWTTDQDFGDEFAQVKQKVEALTSQMDTFRQDARTFYNDMADLEKKMFAGGGTVDLAGFAGPQYIWTDSRGRHSVKVDVRFDWPRLKKKKSGSFLKSKVCIKLIHGADNGRKTWVKITREDPVEQRGQPPRTPTSTLWPWNPSGRVEKIACATYDHQSVGLAKPTRSGRCR